MAVRSAGDFGDGPADLPRTQVPELRRPRAVFFRMRLDSRMARLRWWAVALGAAVAAWQIASLLGPCAAAGSGVDCGAAGLGARLLAALAGPQDELPRLLSSSGVALAAIAAINATLLVLPLALAAVAAVTVCKWRAADSAGIAAAPGSDCWVWPAGQAGDASWQTRPLRLGSAAAHAEAASLRHPSSAAAATPAATAAGGAPEPAPRRYPESAVALVRIAALGSGAGAAGSSLRGGGRQSSGLRIVILTLGTRGDVQPYIALGHALRDAGHTPVICASSDFKEFVEGAPAEGVWRR